MPHTATSEPWSRPGVQGGHVPPDGFVPTAEVAVRIAEAVLAPVYGEQLIALQRPLKATLKGETWFVVGTIAENRMGGVAEVEIAKGDGRIIRMVHSR